MAPRINILMKSTIAYIENHNELNSWPKPEGFRSNRYQDITAGTQT